MIEIRFATKDDLQEMIKLYVDNNPEFASDQKRLKAGLSALLDDSNKGHEVVAISEDEIIGRIHIAKEWSVYRNANFWMFENVYVSPNWRRKGVYTIMHEWIYSRAKTDSTCCGLRFWAFEDNQPARTPIIRCEWKAKLLNFSKMISFLAKTTLNFPNLYL